MFDLRFVAPVTLVATLGFANGCASHTDAPQDNLDESTAALTTARGIDYAWGRPAPSTIRSDGYTFAARYLSYDTTGKNISASEVASLKAAGVDVVVVWEWGANDVLRGYIEGASQAQEAERQATAAGMPAGRPIYFAIDFDATSTEQATINSYFDGVASVIGRNRTGAYAGYYQVKRLFDAGKITWGWQTYAWSGGLWDSRAQLRQVQNGITVGGVDSDLDLAVAGDFGQWMHSGSAPPPPPPTPTGSSCRSATLDENVPTGTCVQAASDANWYHCDNGTWVAGETGCTKSYAYCHSATLGTDVPVRTCVQARSDSQWYQCTGGGWEQPVSNGAGPAGSCSSMHNL
jgi:hypothetical protein